MVKLAGQQAVGTSFEIVLRGLLARKWTILFGALFLAIPTGMYAFLQPDVYRAEALVAPVGSEGEGIGRTLDQLGSLSMLASLGGIGLGVGGISKNVIALETLKSRAFVVGFIQEHDLLVPVMAGSSWDMEKGVLRLNGDWYDTDAQQWVRKVRQGQSVSPTDAEAYAEFSDMLSVTLSRDTGLVTIAVEFVSPVIAKQWVDWLIIDINESMRRSDLDEAERSIEYLKQQIELAQITGIRHALYQLVEDQTQKMMLTKVRPEYVYKTIDPAVVPEKKERPRRITMTVLSTILGALLASLWIVVNIKK